ncbi:type IV secretion system protein [Ruegeria sp.]|uniref:type IV secretion system protein n=1 Tax=Ruegeria sp. TaxID=1879320 RepID=UPI003B00380D
MNPVSFVLHVLLTSCSPGRIQTPGRIFVPKAGRAGAVHLLLLVCLALLLIPEALLAQTARNPASTGSVLNGAVTTMRDSFERASGSIGTLAQQAMLTLLVVDFVLRGGRAIFGGESIPDLMKGFAFQLGFVAFTWGVILWIPEILSELTRIAFEVAQAAGAPSVSAGGMVTDGLIRAISWIDAIRLRDPGTWFYILASGISLIALAIAVAMLISIYAEFYLGGLAGIITLMFAGLTETRDKALNYITGLVGKAFKLMGLMIIVAASGEMTTALADGAGNGIGKAMGMIVLQIVSAILILTLPDSLEKLVGGGLASRAAEMIGATAGGAAKTGVAVAGGAAAGAVAGGVAGAVGAAKAGGAVKDVAKAASIGGATTGFNWGETARNKDVMGALGRKVADRLAKANGDKPQ